ncbi:hypothetical protein AC579_8800 [Pseudocercospora musae]|uniref:Uncharacterized protein n=1 Tax=Pseudocercospora musae TaxID=113226 RepID=A0A139HAC1_9PEZI|nr:hypothetical protein AC579_8800 [Pseudocercospora musae]KXS99391.1 hypothetical protein AC579_8800 [Pseudocercospora musae]
MALPFALTASSISGYPTYTPLSSPTFTCPNCFFGATSATLYSFPYTAVATITEHVFPIVGIYPNGTTCTDYSTSTNFPTITDPYLLNGPTFTDKSQMTWTVANYSMAYPNTYVQYLGFERDSFTATPEIVAGVSVCTGTLSSTAVQLPAQTTAASFIYPLTVTPSTTISDKTLYFSVPLASRLVEYLGGLARDPVCLGLESIKQCAALRTSYANFRGPVDAPTLTLCDTTYSTVAASAPTTSTGAVYPTYPLPPVSSVTTILHCSFVKQLDVAIKAANDDLRGEAAMSPCTTVLHQTEEPRTTAFTVSEPGSSTSHPSTSTSSWTSSTRARNSSRIFSTVSGSQPIKPSMSQHV